MLGCILAGGLLGIESYIVRVEADISDGMPMFELVGYLANEVREARGRVRTALKNAGYHLPIKRITVNLSPAHIKKQGTGFDLPVAVGLLTAMQELTQESIADTVFAGELLLSGEVSGIRGILPIVLAAKRAGCKRCVIPKDNAMEGAVVDGIEIIAVESLTQLVQFLKKECEIAGEKFLGLELMKGQNSAGCDLKDVQGQHFVKRGLESAASGLHNALMIGAPGAGKTMLARCIPTILPPLSLEECLEVSAIYSVAGRLGKMCNLITERPFVSPHHTVTDKALAGGGQVPRPGSISLAHCGVLFLDEMPEFSKSALEVLRQPMEDKVIHITRNYSSCTYPADFMLIGAMNSCPCGAYPDLEKCTCTQTARKNYAARISKPLLDRMDICMEVPKLQYRELTAFHYMENTGAKATVEIKENTEMGEDAKTGEGIETNINSMAKNNLNRDENSEGKENIRTKINTNIKENTIAKKNAGTKANVRAEEDSSTVRARVIKAQQLQAERFQKEAGVLFNSQMGVRQIEKYCQLGTAGKKLIEEAFLKFDLSARAYHRILKTARTIADLDNSILINEYHLSEAIHYRIHME